MKVMNKQQAWHEAEKIIPNAIIDNNAEKSAGYPIYRDITEHYNYICDLGDRLEINLVNGQTFNIWIEKPNTIEEYAACEAATITIRSYENGNSIDTMRNSTDKEKEILKGIISGALSAIKCGKNIQETANIAEYIALYMFPDTENEHVNCFMSVYGKIVNCPDNLLIQ